MNVAIKKALKQGIPRWIVLCIDLYVTLNTFILAFVISNKLSVVGVEKILFFLPEIGLSALGVFLITKSYKGIIRHTGFRDVKRVFFTGGVLAFILIGFSLLFRQSANLVLYAIPIHLIITHFLLNTIVFIILRFTYKTIFRRYVIPQKRIIRTLIYGANQAGLLTQQALVNDPQNTVHVVGFIDHLTHDVGKRMNGIKVYDAGKVDDLFLRHHHIDEIIISNPDLPTESMQSMYDELSQFSVTLKMIPPVTEWLNGDFHARQIRPVKIEDLLGRSPIDDNNPDVHEFLKDKVVLITGAAGSIGSEISRQAIRYPVDTLVFVDQAESALYELQQECQSNGNISGKSVYVVADICDSLRMDVLFSEYKPDIIFHAAAYKHVPLMEENPYEAIRNNIGGTKIISDMAVRHSVKKFIMVSTDKAVNPANIMGVTKRVSELYVNHLNQLHNTQFIVTRFGNVLGSNGSVIPIFKNQIKSGGPLTVTHKEITRYFMTIPEASQLVIVAGSMGKGGEIFIFDIGHSIKIFDLAKRMITLSGLRYPEDIDIRITGLRPGEKLYEELFSKNENSEKTQHEKIMIARFCYQYHSDFEGQINEVIHLNRKITQENGQAQVVAQMLKTIVPEYNPQNSIYTLM